MVLGDRQERQPRFIVQLQQILIQLNTLNNLGSEGLSDETDLDTALALFAQFTDEKWFTYGNRP